MLLCITFSTVSYMKLNLLLKQSKNYIDLTAVEVLTVISVSGIVFRDVGPYRLARKNVLQKNLVSIMI
jgi:hypothetical protein